MPEKALRTAVFPENDLKHAPENRGAAGPLLCRFKWALKRPVSKNTSNNRDFSSAWTLFPLQPEVRAVQMAKGAFYGVF
jgi:hypothetical protein